MKGSSNILQSIIDSIIAKLESLKAVAFSGSYNDLEDKPTIPTDFVSKANGGTFEGEITVNTGSGDSRIILGGNNSYGQVRFLAGNTGFRTSMYPVTLTANRTIEIPDKSGTIALTTDTAPAATKALNDQNDHDIRMFYPNIYANADVGVTSGVTARTAALSGMSMSMINGGDDKPFANSGWYHLINLAWQKNNSGWVSQLAFSVYDGCGVAYRCSNKSSSIDGVYWNRLDTPMYANGYEDITDSNDHNISVPNGVREIKVDYGMKNEGQIYGGGTITLTPGISHPCILPIYSNYDTTPTAIIYIFWTSNNLSVARFYGTLNLRIGYTFK